MALSNYSELQAEFALWCDRDDLAARFPAFLALAEAQMNRVLRAKGSTGRATVTVGTEYVVIPSDLEEVVSFRLADGTRLDPVEQDTLADFEPATGTPRFYAIVGANFHFYPTPATPVSADLTYYAKVPALTVTAPTNWVLTGHPDAYLYGALSHAAPYLRDGTMGSVWKGLAESALSEIGTARHRPGGKLRSDHLTQLSRTPAYDVTRG